MTLPRSRSSARWLAVTAAAFAVALLIAPRAHAFTVEDSGTNPDGTAKFSDPDMRFDRSASDRSGLVTQQYGNTTLKFGTPGSLNGDSNPRDYESFKERMFNPLGKPGQ